MTDGGLIISETGATELLAAFVKAQAEMGDVLKQATNPAFKSKYADLASVLDAVMPALSKHGLGMIQAPTFDGEVASVETIIIHCAGGTMRSTLSLRPTKADPQGLGSAITYGRRYAALAICGVAPEDDDGNGASGAGAGGQRHPEPARASSAQLKKDGVWETYSDGMKAAKTPAELGAWHARADAHAMYDRMTQTWKEQVAELHDQLLADMKDSGGERV